MSSIKEVTSEITAVQKKTIMDVFRDIRARIKETLKTLKDEK